MTNFFTLLACVFAVVFYTMVLNVVTWVYLRFYPESNGPARLVRRWSNGLARAIVGQLTPRSIILIATIEVFCQSFRTIDVLVTSTIVTFAMILPFVALFIPARLLMMWLDKKPEQFSAASGKVFGDLGQAVVGYEVAVSFFIVVIGGIMVTLGLTSLSAFGALSAFALLLYIGGSILWPLLAE